MIEFSDDQKEAEARIEEFLSERNPPRRWFSIEGAAGCGKSVLLGQIARKRPSALLCTAFNKSAFNLTMKSGKEASTIYAAIYKFEGEETDEFGNVDLRFEEIIEKDAWSKKIALVDESGTCDEALGRDLMATGVRVIAAGDPFQLKPVRGKRFFDRGDFVLTKVHRQAWDSPIIRQAHAVKKGLTYQPDGDAFRVERFIGRDDILRADVILCWRNTTRQQLNKLKRAHLLGIHDPRQPPVAGEPLMALSNDKRMGVFNGAIYVLEEDATDYGYGGVSVVLRNERGHIVRLDECWVENCNETMKGETTDAGTRSVGFALAYSGTCHKWLGSEADNVIVVDEYIGDERNEWIYTSITRAKQTIIMQRNW